MRRGAILAVWLVVSACGEEVAVGSRAVARPPPVPAGRLRITPLQDVADEARWAEHWLDLEGWEFWGFDFEAGAASEIVVRWSDPRFEEGTCGEITCRLAPQTPLRLVWGIRVRPLILGPRQVACDGCGSAFKVGGALTLSWTCPKCQHEGSLDPDWSAAPFREFRVLAAGNSAVQVSAPLRLTSHGDRWLIGGRVRRRSALRLARARDVVRPLRRPSLWKPGTHVFARLFDLGEASDAISSVSGNEREMRFEYTRGNVGIAGTPEAYEIRIDGAAVALADYPHPVWEFAVRFRPQE